MTVLLKEVCVHCRRAICVGQPIVECYECDCVIHSKCYNFAEIYQSNEKLYCNDCCHLSVKRYNPFRHDTDDNDLDLDDNTQKLTNILEKCSSHSVKQVNRFYKENYSGHKSIIFQNIDGNKTNFDTLAIEMKRFDFEFSIIALAETNEGPDMKNLYQLTNYESFYQEKISPAKKKGSGVALYVHKTLNAEISHEVSRVTENLETLFVKLTNGNTPVIAGVLYRPPSGDIDKALIELGEILDELPKHTHLCGDFNIDLHANANKHIADLEDVIMSRGFFPLISTITHEKPGCRGSCIDNIITNEIENIVYSGTINEKISHHYPIFQIFESDIMPINSNEKHMQYYDYCNSNVENFVDTLSTELGNYTRNCFGTFLQKFNSALDQTCKLETPKCSKRTMQNNPWITGGIIASINKCHELYKEWVKARKVICGLGEKDTKGGTCFCNVCCRKRLSYMKYKNYRKILKKIKDGAKAKYNNSKFEENKGNSKKTWELINKIRGKQQHQLKPMFLIDNEKITNRRTIANEFNKYFASLASNLNTAYNEIGEVTISPLPSFHDYLPSSNSSSIYLNYCSPEEVDNIIRELKNGKASDIPIHVIKQSSRVISPVLCVLYNRCMKDGIFPDELKIGKISPIYKKDNKELLENYRPVSTLAIFGKIFEKIIYNRLYNFITSQGLMYENQYGFRKNHSTSHALNFSVNYIESCLKNKQHVLGIFIDLSKAFDTISHDKLLYKLANYGIRGKVLELIKSYLTNRLQYVSTLGEDSAKMSVKFGVPQGSVLGPLLFIIYMNDIYKSTDLGKFILFADDTNIFVADNCKEKVYEIANEVMECIYKYMRCNLLHINFKKCCYMHFRPGKNHTVDEQKLLTLNGRVVKRVSETKFLGVIIDDKLNWNSHIKYLNSKLKCETGKLNRIIKQIPKIMHKDLYHTLFESHLSYGISVWGGVSYNKLKPLFLTQKKCIRIIFGDSKAYFDKFRTCARTRIIGNQTLGPEFFEQEHTKPIFNKNKLLSIYHLYKYYCLLEMFKIIKLRMPISLYSLFNRSARRENYFLTSLPSTSFIHKSAYMWNNCYRNSKVDFTTSINTIKIQLKDELLNVQKLYDDDTWLIYNHDLTEFTF